MQVRFLGALAVVSLLTGCGKEEDKKRGGVLTLVNPIVERSIPDSFRQPGASLAVNQSSTDGESIQNFLTRTSLSIFSGKMRSGDVRKVLQDLDDRIAEVDGSISPDEVGCLNAPLTDMIGDSGFASHRVALKVSCFRPSGAPAGPGSGLAFGQDENFTYVSLILTQEAKQDSQKTGFWAKIDRATEEVDFLFLEHFEVSDGSIRRQFFRVKANPNTQFFQFAGSGNGVVGDETFAPLGAGTRLASNASSIIVEGDACSTPDVSNICGFGKQITFAPNSCFSATDFSSIDAANCSGISFSTDLPLVERGGYYTGDQLNAAAATTMFDSFNVNAVISGTSGF